MTITVCPRRQLAILIPTLVFQTALAGTQLEPKNPSRPKAAMPDLDETTAREQRFEEMRRLAGSLKFEETREDLRSQYMLVERPLLHFTDPDRMILDGTLWAYGREGRPVAILEMFCGREIPGLYRHAVTATSDRPLQRMGSSKIRWAPTMSAVRWSPLRTDTPPAADAMTRLRQIKTLAQRFSAHQIYDPGMQRSELRLLVQPVHRYSDNEEGIRDAALFILALGTNPEVLLFIEAHDHSRDAATWHYGLARRGTAEFHVLLDQEEVWTLPRLTKTKLEDPICHFYRSLTGEEMKGEP